MNRQRVETCAAKTARERVGNHHRAMTPARAADADSDIRLSFAFVKRQQVIEQIAETSQRLLNVRLRFQIFDHATVVAGKLAQFRHEEWIRQMSNVKEQLHVERAAILVSEAQDLHAHGRAFQVRIKDRKSTRLNSSHTVISYAVFCLK